MDSNTPLRVGIQVAYIPSHVRQECENDFDCMIMHASTGFGFVSSWDKDGVFVRFWSDYFMAGIRTVANSEACSWEDLELYNSHSDDEVQRIISKFRSDVVKYGWVEQEQAAVSASVDTKSLLNEYSGNLSLIDLINGNKQELIDKAIPPEVKEKLAEIEAEFAPQLARVNYRNQELVDQIKAEVLAAKETISGDWHQAVYSKGKTSWDDDKLIGYAAAHPEIKDFRITGKPSVSFRAKGKAK